MTPDERANLEKVLNHVLVHGEAYMVDGKLVEPKDVYKDDAELRAEKILLETPCGKDREANIAKAIAAQIREAEQEAFERGIEMVPEETRRWMDEMRDDLMKADEEKAIAIREAVEEALVKESDRKASCVCGPASGPCALHKDCYRGWQAEAYEDAAKIAEWCPCDNDSHCQWISEMAATRIRARAKEVGK